MIQLYNKDCLQALENMYQDGVKVDFILADIPYGTTNCKWDTIIPLNAHIVEDNFVLYKDDFILKKVKEGYSYKKALDFFLQHSNEGMWEKIYKVLKPNGVVALFGAEPFSSVLRSSNINYFKYDWIWHKTTATGHLNAKHQSMRASENISIFYKQKPFFNPLKTKNHKEKISSKNSKISSSKKAQNRDKVYRGDNIKNIKDYKSTERYPRTVITFPTDKQKIKLHPTQKPVALGQYFLKTYMKKGETILDFTMGSGSFGVSAVKEGMNFIGVEKDKVTFNKACDRIQKELEYKKKIGNEVYFKEADRKFNDILDKYKTFFN